MELGVCRSGMWIVAGCLAFGGHGIGVAQEEFEEKEVEASEEAVEEATGPVEEIVVTAQRKEESLEDVPISITALTEDTLEERQVVTISDVQLNDTSLTFTSTNFGNASLSIRGIGRLVIGAAGTPGVSTHVKQVDLPFQFGQHELFDIQRVEVLRGPQGTLYGRNATGGSINIVPNMPDPTSTTGVFGMELGNFAHLRYKGTVNVALGDNAAVRVAGYRLLRDGYTKNLAYDQAGRATGQTLSNIDQDVDGRNISALRFSFSWEPSDRISYWFQYHYMHEDDDRTRRTAQLCARSPSPVEGCKPNEHQFGVPHLGASTSGILAIGLGLQALGDSGSDPRLYDHPRPEIDSHREVHTDFEPVFNLDEVMVLSGITVNLGLVEAEVTGGSIDRLFLSREDFRSDVGPLMGGGIAWPVSLPAGKAGDQWTTSLCNIYTGEAGVLGGCVHGSYRQQFSYDQSTSDTKYWTSEIRLRSLFDGPWNFSVGYSRNWSRSITDYYVFSNVTDAVTVRGVPALGLPGSYPGFFITSNSPFEGAVEENSGLFGEMYFDVSPALRLTLGLRYNDDFRSREDTRAGFNAVNQTHVWVGSVVPALRSLLRLPASVPVPVVMNAATRLGLVDPGWAANLPGLIQGAMIWSRTTNLLLGILGGPAEVDLVRFYAARLDPDDLADTLESWGAANLDAMIARALGSPAYSLDRVRLSRFVPIVPDFGEARGLTNSPDSAEFTFVSSRVGADYRINRDLMVYGFFSRGYKPGGLNPAIPVEFQDTSSFTFEKEVVNAFEAGTKARLMDGRLRFSGAAFVYDYQGLQTVRIKNNAAINENMDVAISGLEMDGVWAVTEDGSISLDFGYTYLNSTIEDTMSLDPQNRTAGNSDYITVKNIDLGATGINFVVRESQITAAITQAALANGAAYPVFRAPNERGVAIPYYWSRRFLEAIGVDTSEGILTDLSGNQLPNAPSHAVKIGLSYTVPHSLWKRGTLVVRWDYFWQGEQFAREFNTPGDYIDPWGQHNMSVNYVSGNGRYEGRFWMRNVLDDENVTGHYLTSDSSGFFRNVFTTEPRIFGLSARLRLRN